MTRYGYDWAWDYEHGTWCIFPHVDEATAHAELLNDFNAGLHAKDKANGTH